MKVHTLDLMHQGFERAIAAYLVEGTDGYILIETGPMSTLPTLKEKIHEHGVGVKDIHHVLVTHIHLDHAGAAGWWAQQGAMVYVHYVGAPHIVDPSRLWKSATRIYGNDMQKLWGEMVPAPENAIIPLTDNATLEVAGLKVIARDTPGHAWHHLTYQIDSSAFTGDVAGVRLIPEEWVSLPAPPPEFDLDAWHSSLERLRSLQLEALYLTHFGKVVEPDDHLRQLRDTLEAATDFVRREIERGTGRDELVRRYQSWNEARAQQMGTGAASFEGRYEAANPLFMSVDGIIRYWRKYQETDSPSSV